MLTERRKSRRFSGRIGVVSSDDEGLNFSFITDLSREGAYIETERLIPIGTRFQFVLSNGRMTAPIAGKVVRARDAFFHGGRSGMGILFERMEGASKVVRDDLLLCLMNARFHQMWEAA
jgi:hypothetical protein